MKKIIFTDLDGTLLDSATYSMKAAEPALDLARQKGIPVVFVSSKTRPEMETWRKRLGNSHPFIVENGGGIYIPRNYFSFPLAGSLRGEYVLISLGKPYESVRKQFMQMRDRLKIAVRGFGDMTVDEVAALTGLERDEAGQAKDRDFSEPFVFPGLPQERFLQEIEAVKLRWTQGQFFHVMGNHHKGKAVDMLRAFYNREYGACTSVGIGDSLNDLPFLLAVDKPVIVKKRSGKHDARIAIPGLLRTRGKGPEGWNEAVLELMKQ